MTEIETFFDAWSMSDADARAIAVREALRLDAAYADPRTEAPLNGVDAIASYIGMFSEMAPGAKAVVVKSDTIQNSARVTVAFRMSDGKEQLGQYFVEPASGKIGRLTGFVGTGAPE